MTAIYNEIEPYAARWLGNLSDAGHIARGPVLTQSIKELTPDDVRHATQAHFFAGIGAWSHALRLAGWPDDAPVWTGSCPCQPFSVAGKRGGTDDERHLWPEWFRLIRECRPQFVFGEQVASRDGYAWLDAVHADLEGAGYTVGAAVLPAAGVGAPHGRHRIFFVAHAQRHDGRWKHGNRVGAATGGDQVEGDQRQRFRADTTDGSAVGGVGYASRARLEGHPGHGDGCRGRTGAIGSVAEASTPSHPHATNSHWRVADWLPCRDGKARPVEPGTFPLAHGATARVGRLRAYGNAIVPQAAAAFIRALLDVMGDESPHGL